MKKTARLGALVLSAALFLSALPARALPARGYQEGLAPTGEGGLWGFVDSAGKVVISPIYDSVDDFSLGLATVELKGKLGVIRPDGEYLLRPEYDSLLSVDYGLYIARKGGEWGVVSILPYTNGSGERTCEVYPIEYAGVERGQSGGVEALILTHTDGGKTVIPLFRLPSLLAQLGVDGSQFPLNRGKLPAFQDVRGRDWLSLWVDIVYNTGIMSGTGGDTFEPHRVVTVAQCLQMAANMDSRYRGDSFHTTDHQLSPWYQEAVDYCLASGIIAPGQFDDFEREITRRELAQVFAATALARSLPNLNSITRVAASVRDVSPLEPGASVIYSLYAKGILTGVDGRLSFNPDAAVTRAEAAALCARLARPEQRVELFK